MGKTIKKKKKRSIYSGRKVVCKQNKSINKNPNFWSNGCVQIK